ncbi:hypothetical protein H5410_027386, partial [Solanum commersonii]
MNIHNKTQITCAKINYVLKDSSSDTPLPKILMITILATCASSSSSSTKRIKCTAHTQKEEHNAYSLKIKKVFLRLVMGLSAK